MLELMLCRYVLSVTTRYKAIGDGLDTSVFHHISKGDMTQSTGRPPVRSFYLTVFSSYRCRRESLFSYVAKTPKNSKIAKRYLPHHLTFHVFGKCGQASSQLIFLSVFLSDLTLG